MLDLSNNKLEDLPNDTFAGLPILKQLYLGENLIEHLQPEAFSSNSSIVSLTFTIYLLNLYFRQY